MQIFPNGTLRFVNKSSAEDIDENGLPIAANRSDYQEIGCTITTTQENNRGRYEDGRYKSVSYSVTCNLEDAGEGFNPTTISLTHEDKGELGEFTVQRIEYYKITGTIELWV